MENSYEKDGIIYFYEPFEVKRVDWIYKHLDCDSIISRDSVNGSKIYIICYASSEKYNDALKAVKDEQYSDYLLLRGVGHEEVNCID